MEGQAEFILIRKNMRKLFFALLLVAVCMPRRILDSAQLQDFMFSEEIKGEKTILNPTKLTSRRGYQFPIETYEISMVNAKHQFLPKGFPSTSIYAYAGKTRQGKFKPEFPGPSILAFMDSPIQVVWTNEIKGEHILPLDFSPPMDMIKPFANEVPVVPHLHGLESQSQSDGQPLSFWTKSGRTGSLFSSLSSNRTSNQAVYRYLNTKQGLYFYHDHTIAMTRLNSYAGLVGSYEIVDPKISSEERNVMKVYGDLQRKHFFIADKSFYENGDLYYPTESPFPDFTSWVPEFFGNTITVNGKVWPKVILTPKIYRFVIINACQSRFLNIRFSNKGKALPFEIFRRDADFLRKPVTLTEHLLLIAGRIQIFIDLRNVQGQILVTNDAAAPFPDGEAPDKFTSKIMKIVVKEKKKRLLSGTDIPYDQSYKIGSKEFQQLGSVQSQNQFEETLISEVRGRLNVLNPGQKIELKYYPPEQIFNSWPFISAYPGYIQKQFVYGSNLAKQNPPMLIKDTKYPAFDQGEPYFTVLTNVENGNGDLTGIMIDAVSMDLGSSCERATFKLGSTYDFYIVNLSEDEHPMHIHLVNFQVIGRFDFNVSAYRQDWYRINGKPGPRGFNKVPKQLDPRPYQISKTQPPAPEEQLFMDVIGVPINKVTIARIKIANHKGKDFPFDVRGSRYVWHCHILEHEDNEMMRWFCIE